VLSTSHAPIVLSEKQKKYLGKNWCIAVTFCRFAGLPYVGRSFECPATGLKKALIAEFIAFWALLNRNVKKKARYVG
jgi:hypothetical protein